MKDFSQTPVCEKWVKLKGAQVGCHSLWIVVVFDVGIDRNQCIGGVRKEVIGNLLATVVIAGGQGDVWPGNDD